MIMSFTLSVRKRSPSSSRKPASPVESHPPGATTRVVSSGSFQ